MNHTGIFLKEPKQMTFIELNFVCEKKNNGIYIQIVMLHV